MTIFKNGVLVSSTQQSGSTDGYKNIGDYVQSLAQIHFSGAEDVVYVDKERISEFQGNGSKVRVILNAWWIVFTKYWPPSEDILPLLLSMHISPSKADGMLSEEGISYLKKFGPVGCRDRGTEEILKKKGVECYYSGCLTLALGLRYKNPETIDKVIFVDPYIEAVRDEDGKFSASLMLSNILYGIARLSKVTRLYSRFNHFYCLSGRFKSVRKFACVSAFYRTYRNKFSDEILFGAKYLTQSVKIGDGTIYNTEDEKMQLAEQFVVDYSDASLVITSRIHCALPCLGLETPVLFVHSEGAGHARDPGRFGGVVELFNVLKYSNFNLLSDGKNIPSKIDRETLKNIKNKDSYIEIMENMASKCKDFFKAQK